MGLCQKLKTARAKTPTAEKLNPTPLAIIAGAKRPETMTEAITRILNHSLNQEEWERVRGVEYDSLSDEDTDAADDDFESFENGGKEHDDAGYFADNQKKGGKDNAGKHESQGESVDNSNNGSPGDNLGTNKESFVKQNSQGELNEP